MDSCGVGDYLKSPKPHSLLLCAWTGVKRARVRPPRDKPFGGLGFGVARVEIVCLLQWDILAVEKLHPIGAVRPGKKGVRIGEIVIHLDAFGKLARDPQNVNGIVSRVILKRGF